MARAALYCRVSTADQDPGSQIEELRRVAKQRGWTVVGEYVDHGVSGGRERRPELDRLQRDISRAKVDVVVVVKFDRFARSLSHLLRALADFQARGVDFVSTSDEIDTATPAGKLTFHILGAMAEFERDLIRDRTVAGLRAARHRGARLGRPPVCVDVPKALRLRAEGVPMKVIAQRLNVGLSTLRRALSEARKAAEESSAA